MRVLVTGIGTRVGSRVAAELERRADVDVVVGVDSRAPRVPLDRVEFVRSDPSYELVQRVLDATAIDTVVHALLELDSTGAGARGVSERNAVATMHLLAACAAAAPAIRRVVMLGATSVYGTSHAAPYVRRETDAPTAPAGGVLERSLAERERFALDFADDAPEVAVGVVRAADVLGPEADGPLARVLRRPLVPEALGYDPLVQVVHEDDVVEALVVAVRRGARGAYNLAGAGPMPWSDVCRLLRRRRVPLPPVVGEGAALALRAVGLAEATPELIDLLRWGRVVECSRLAELGFRPRHTTAGTVADVARAQRLARTVGRPPRYRYTQDVEEFFRYSPAVVRRG